MTGPILAVEQLSRVFSHGRSPIHALNSVNLSIDRGEFVSVVGSSGSGKSTLLALMAGLDTPTSGRIVCDGEELHLMTRRDMSRYRAKRVGMIFQSFNLIPHFTALQNVEVALLFTGVVHHERKDRAAEALERLGLSDRMTHRPAQLSGGEQQRVAIARAVVKNPDIVFADEPTGNLDHDNATHIASLLSQLNREGLTIIMVTHNADLARHTSHRIITLDYGQVTGDLSIDRTPESAQ